MSRTALVKLLHRWQLAEAVADVAPEEFGCETVSPWPAYHQAPAADPYGYRRNGAPTALPLGRVSDRSPPSTVGTPCGDELAMAVAPRPSTCTIRGIDSPLPQPGVHASAGRPSDGWLLYLPAGNLRPQAAGDSAESIGGWKRWRKWQNHEEAGYRSPGCGWGGSGGVVWSRLPPHLLSRWCHRRRRRSLGRSSTRR